MIASGTIHRIMKDADKRAKNTAAGVCGTDRPPRGLHPDAPDQSTRAIIHSFDRDKSSHGAEIG